MSQFLHKNSRDAVSVVGSSCAPMDAVFVGSVRWTWNLTISSAGLKEVDLGLLTSITSSLSTVERNTVSSSAARALDNAPRVSAAVLFFGTECYVRITSYSDDSIGLEHLELHVPVMGYTLEDRECLSP